MFNIGLMELAVMLVIVGLPAAVVVSLIFRYRGNFRTRSVAPAFCSNCGAPFPATAAFCAACGNRRT